MSSPQGPEFALNPRLNIGQLADRFASFGRMQIGDFLTPDAAAHLHAYLERSDRWHRLFNAQDRFYEFPCAEWEAMPESDRNRLSRAIDESAAYGFQYRYDTIRVDERAIATQAGSDSLLDRFAQFLSSPPVLQMLMNITGSTDLVFADCQATRYRAGDFLTPHDDELDGMNRKFAYVLNLTPDWRPRWGGLLHFVDHTGGVEETISPRFNALSLFAVGQSHYVSQVATYAPVPRISVTGWLRTQVPGGY